MPADRLWNALLDKQKAGDHKESQEKATEHEVCRIHVDATKSGPSEGGGGKIKADGGGKDR
ncbi:hypothetical protein DSLASN_14550 [Desulfoluna limicola]|uniref:Uncharacterized protein n=1 Tax=Desulfoluna limicola TaxID=2810562 RepID=A0ABM7PE71_9BACT|nr:hypothetical protein DSLASN_14550 [Desulfoluna limicola]